MTRAGISAALLVLLTAGGCGRVGPPVAPQLREPQPVTELQAVESEGVIEVSWINPRHRVDRSPLLDLARVHVFRAEDAGLGEPKSALRSRGRIAGYDEIATIRLADPAPATVEGARIVFPDRQGLAYGRRYTYVILTEDAQGRLSPPSPRLPVAYIAPPAAPGNLSALPGESEVRLRWDPATRLVDGSPVQGEITYEVLRAAGPDAALEVIPPGPVGETRFTDRGLVNDQTYAYAVRTLRSDTGGRARSQLSDRLAATPVDGTPPAPPQRLVAVATAADVRLAWASSPDPDVARYVVYRADPRGTFIRIGTTGRGSTTFVDSGVGSGDHRYVVTAQDASSRANESARSNEASAAVP